MLRQLDAWLDAPGDTGWVVVTGSPGMGKGAILSAWLTRRERAGAVVPYHLVRRQVADWDQPAAIAASLAAQIEAVFPDCRDPAASPERRLLELLGRVSTQHGAARRLVVVVDGLDETQAEPGENPLPQFLPHVMPPGIRFLCATRPTYPHLNWLEARGRVRLLDLDDARWASSNVAVVRGFWATVASDYQPPLSAEIVAAAIARAEGNVLHAVMLHDALSDLPAEERDADRIPRGLQELIGDVWDRAAAQEAVRVGLGVLCAAREALSLDVIAELAGWSYDDKQHFVRGARQLLLEEPAAWAGAATYRPRHDWVRELISVRLGAATMRDHHVRLSRALAAWPAPAGATARRYALRHALIHRAEAGDWTDTWRLAGNMRFVEEKCRELGVHEAEVDIARVAECCRASDDGDAAIARRLGDLARALGRDSHWLSEAPEATTGLVWNRLRRSGWIADELDEQLRGPDDAGFLRVRHAVTRESPALVRDLVGHADWVKACTVTPDGRRVVSASDDRTLKVWDLETGRPLATLVGHTGEVNACAVTPDSRRAVSASLDETLRVWDLETGRPLATLVGHTTGVTACAVTPDGRRLVSASVDGTLKVWDFETGRPLATLVGHTTGVTACAVTLDGRCVVSASDDRTLRVWDLATGQPFAILEGHAKSVMACAVTPDGRRVVSASADGTLKVWDLETSRPLVALAGHASRVNACAVTPDGRRVVSASWDLTLKVWDLETGRPPATLEGHAGGVNACAVTPDGRRLVSASNDQTLHVWDLETGRPLATLAGHAGWVNACAVTPDGRRLVSASNDQMLHVWGLETGRLLAILEGHAHGVNACVVTPDGRHVVSASDDSTLKVWDLETGRPLATLEGHARWVNACAVTPDGRRVVSASTDKTLKVWDLETGRPLATLAAHAGGVNACAVPPDSRRVVSASNDRTLKLWDLEIGRPLATLESHADRVTACAVTPDGRRVVSASEDRTLKVWDLETYACLVTHRGDAPYAAVATSATAIVAGDAAGGLWILDWPPSAMRHRG